jgi:uncharacterized membrane protein
MARERASSRVGDSLAHTAYENRPVEERTLTFGPVQMLSIVFEGNRFKGEILPELERLKKNGVVRIIDLVAVRKDEMGAVATLTASDLDWEEATEYGAYLGTLIGFGAGGSELAERGAIAGAAEFADGHLFDADDIWRLTRSVPEGMSVAIALLEHIWALPLQEAIDHANGLELSNRWLTVEELVNVGLRGAADEG